jgi:hypothetical protein
MKTENFPADFIASLAHYVTNAGPGYDNWVRVSMAEW